MKPTRAVWALVAYAAAWVWAWWTGPVGFVLAAVIFTGGFAFGRRSGHRQATVDAAREITRADPKATLEVLHS